MQIIPYHPQFKQDFIRLNKAWVEKFFGTLEEEDLHTLGHVEEILARGGQVFFAVQNGQVLATCMAKPLPGGVWEICKLAADEKAQGRGAGSGVFKACLEHAQESGAKKIILISNRILKPALHLYQKFGFTEVPLEGQPYARADIQFEFIPFPKVSAR